MEQEKPHNIYDKVLKHNFETFALSFLQKYAHIDIVKKQTIPAKIQVIEERETDFLFIVTDSNSEKYILNIEFQVSDTDEMRRRMLMYYSILYYKYKLPVKQYIIYLGEEELTYLNQTIHEDKNVYYSCNVVRMIDISFSDLLRSEVAEDVVMAVLCNYENTDSEEVVKKIIARLKSITNKETLKRYLLYLRYLSLLRNNQEIVLKYSIPMIAELNIDIRKDPYYIKGHTEGIEKGIEKGIHKTKRINAVNAIITQLDDKTISIITGLLEGEVAELRRLYEKYGRNLLKMLEDDKL